MTNIKSSLIVAALVSAFGVTAASASSVDQLVQTNGVSDFTAAGIAATHQNIETLGVSTRAGDVITARERAAIQQIVLDQSTFESKARRVDLVVNGEDAGYGKGYSIEW